MKKKIIGILLIGIAITFTGCTKQEVHSIDMNSGEVAKTQIDQENNAQYDMTEKEVEQKSSAQEILQESSDNTQSNETPQESSDSAQNKEETQDLYAAFLKNEVSATADKDFPQNDYKIYNLELGKSYTFTELGEYVNASYFDPEYSIKTSYDNAQYAYLESADNHTRILLVKFSGLGIYAPDDDSFAVYVIAENEGKLSLTSFYECWARSYTKACKNGLLVSGGSAGAGDHIEVESVVLTNGKVVDIYATEILSGSWARSIDETIYNEVFAGNEDILFSVMIHTIGDKILHTYDLSECTDNQISVCETYVNRCRDEAGINWVTENDVQKAIQERCGALNIDDKIIAQQEEVEWIDIQ